MVKQEKSPQRAIFLPSYILRTLYIVHCTSSLPLVFLIVLLAADFPEVRVHRGLAVRGVFLSSESGLVGTDLHQILCTGCYGCTNGCKTVA